LTRSGLPGAIECGGKANATILDLNLPDLVLASFVPHKVSIVLGEDCMIAGSLEFRLHASNGAASHDHTAEILGGCGGCSIVLGFAGISVCGEHGLSSDAALDNRRASARRQCSQNSQDDVRLRGGPEDHFPHIRYRYRGDYAGHPENPIQQLRAGAAEPSG
jgi:hypothetical protein